MPGLKAKCPDEFISISKRNSSIIDEALNEYLSNPTEIVFINEISLFFPFGDFEKVEKILKKARTVILTGYYGHLLANDLGTGIFNKKKAFMELLMGYADLIIYLPPPISVFKEIIEETNTENLNYKV